ncbi:hypothetical protein I4U23_022723 [Adineta vaga]|nr:hypothetical protein I4U23_022723 [Adineta vaga]
MAFFILYEFFSASYTDMLDLKYSKLSRLCFWLLIIFSTIAVAFEYFVYAFDQLVEEKGDGINGSMKNETFLVPSDSHYINIAQYFDIGKEICELLATVSCYSLLILQFFIKKERKSI